MTVSESVTQGPIFAKGEGGQRVVVIAMKTQLRGRIRRSVTTLLAEGAVVTVLGLRSDKDFTVGLVHPNLSVELLDPSSLYLWVVKIQQRAANNRRRRRQERCHGTPLRYLRRISRYLVAGLARAGTSIAGGIRRVRKGFVGALKPVVEAVSSDDSGSPAISTVVEVESRLASSVTEGSRGRLTAAVESSGISSAPFIKRGASLPLGFSRFVPAQVRRRLVTLRRQFGLLKLHQRRRATERRNRLTIAIRRRVLPFHRITRWVVFWRISFRRAIQLQPDFVISSDLPGLVGASIAARKLGVPHVHDCHELYLGSTTIGAIERTILSPIERFYMRRAGALVFVNESIRQEYSDRYGVTGEVVRNCAEQGDTRPGEDLCGLIGVAPSVRLVLYQGGFSVGRGLDVVIEAVRGFPDDTHLVMMGYGPLEQELREIAVAHAVDDRVTFVAAVPPEQLLSTTASASVGLVPYQPVSANNRLALPNKIFEYTAVGLPVVVSDLPELARIANQGVGLTYDPFDPIDLARAVTEILSPGVIEDAQAASRNWGRENTWELEQRKLIELWKHVAR
jgi:glycosyltransferase involved in cell wall biosynthesis